MAIKLTKEDSKVYEEVQSAIKNLDDAIASLSNALIVDPGIIEVVLTESQRRDAARTAAGLLMHREDLISLGLTVGRAVHRNPFVVNDSSML